MAVAENNEGTAGSREAPWPELRRRVARRMGRRNLRILWPEPCGAGGVLRWGMVAATGPLAPSLRMLSKIAGGGESATGETPVGADLETWAEALIGRLGQGVLERSTLVEAVAWAYAMPELAVDPRWQFPEGLWWDLLAELQSAHRAAIEETEVASAERLWAGGELGAVLAWRLEDVRSCGLLRDPALEAIAQWFDASGYAVAKAVQGGGLWSRLVLASSLRCRRLAGRMKRSIPVRRAGAAIDLATWVAGMTRADGSMALSPVAIGPASDIRPEDDLGEDGLLAMAAREVGGPALRTAIDASLGQIKSDGRLAWRVQLPEPGWFEEDAQLAVMLPEWDVRRGRVAIDFSGPKTRVEVSGGKRPLITGEWTVELNLGDAPPMRPETEWAEVCFYSDDDVHYLELEQQYPDGIKVQRQLLMLRDDRALLMADAVIGGPPGKVMRYRCVLPLAPTVHVEEERETRELVLVDGKPRGLLVPLALNEWRTGRSAGTVEIIDADVTHAADNGHASDPNTDPTWSGALSVVSTMRGEGALYCPLWIDLDRKRIRRERTWRRLTVGQSLRLVSDNEAVAFRVHCGSDQWLVYRSLNGKHNRTFLGKNLVSEFFCGRFDAEDGSVEELIAVDEQSE